jgi:hypothetical protein
MKHWQHTFRAAASELNGERLWDKLENQELHISG